MKRLRKIKVTAEVPKNLIGLKELANNLWWSWSCEAQQLFTDIDAVLYEKNNNNPIKLLSKVCQERLQELSENQEFLNNYNNVMKEFNIYMNQENTWFNKKHSKHKDKKIAYFCAEFGVHECVPIYSGGLGVLAGDHAKSASDLGLPFTGVGLLYRQGYFEQKIDNDGRQKNEFNSHDFNDIPITLVKDENGNEIKISVELDSRQVYARAWKLQVGRVSIYLLDADIEENSAKDREITYKLYGGDQEMRISQEILLGMGGVRLIRKLGISPDVWHMNEGHSVFLALERIAEYVVADKMTFYEALEAVRANTLFTTHTPVPAGNDAFPLTLKDKYFRKYWVKVGLSRQQFMDLGLQVMPEGYELFSLTILALKVAGRSNGVSRLHGDVSSDLWKEVWKDIPKFENPITYVTNGVHTLTWMAPQIKKLLGEYLRKDWMYYISDPKTWEDIDKIPDEKLWQTHVELKREFINFSKKWMKQQYRRNRLSAEQIGEIDNMFDENALVIGFARRFATYKRATLLFRNIERLKKIMNVENMKIHFVFAGKAHPADRGGQALIENIHAIAKKEGFKGKIYFLENYSLHVSRYMVRGVDVWLNNPKRPLEASGTSGQKVPVNGGLNFSILDGWWDEGYNGKNGWAINPNIETVENDEEQSDIDANSMYDILENQILPLYYDRDKNQIPTKWIKAMKESMKSVNPEFSMDNMVINYSNRIYVPAMESGETYRKEDCKIAKQVATDRYNTMSLWKEVSVEDLKGFETLENIKPGKDITISLKVNTGNLSAEHIKAELCIYGKNEKPIDIIPLNSKKAGNNLEFELKYTWKHSGEFFVGVRLVPYINHMVHPYELGKAYWLS
ncbi:MAG: alpha-glucan family phosphorylase [Candidatus Muirbacterium halophilum]|nr:alpha-glucan family phosphorylase [Candidatus Muirbacterium halophilum]MCK9475967.1 alpha-glucan family phosphorylase [Candidatus Muirbacterium halophilum]